MYVQVGCAIYALVWRYALRAAFDMGFEVDTVTITVTITVTQSQSQSFPTISVIFSHFVQTQPLLTGVTIPGIPEEPKGSLHGMPPRGTHPR